MLPSAEPSAASPRSLSQTETKSPPPRSLDFVLAISKTSNNLCLNFSGFPSGHWSKSRIWEKADSSRFPGAPCHHGHRQAVSRNLRYLWLKPQSVISVLPVFHEKMAILSICVIAEWPSLEMTSPQTICFGKDVVWIKLSCSCPFFLVQTSGEKLCLDKFWLPISCS